MYTHKSISNERKLTSSIALSLLLLSAITVLIPVAPVFGISGGAPKLGVVTQTGPNSGPTLTSSYFGAIYVNATAGSIVASTDAPAHAGNLTIFTFASGVDLVTFSGAQFYLSLSTNGLSEAVLGAGDLRYAGPFLTSDLPLPLKAYPTVNGTFYIGHSTLAGGACGGNCQIIEGPLPIQISSGYKFIKLFDGSTVAALQYINIAPGIQITPTSGPANEPVTVMGGGFAPSLTIGLNYSFTFYPFPSGAGVPTGQKTWERGVSTGLGYFSHTYNIIDTKQAYNAAAGGHADGITITAVGGTKMNTLLANRAPAASAVFTENSRQFSQVISRQYDGTLVVTTGIGTYGNSSSAVNPTSIAPWLPSQPVDVFAFGYLTIAGNYTYWGGAVSVWVSNGLNTGWFQIPIHSGSATAGSSLSHPGSYNVTVVVPANLTIGTHTIKVYTHNVYYTFQVDMNPTLILNPYKGPVSPVATHVAASVYGFPAHLNVFIYWYEITYGDGYYWYMVNFTTNTGGTATGSFVVPHAYGGPHEVWANAGNDTSPTSALDNQITYAIFTVTPTLVVAPATFPNNGSVIIVQGEGFVPGTYYSVNMDNQQSDMATVCSPYSANEVITSGVVTTSYSLTTSSHFTTVNGELEPDHDSDNGPYLFTLTNSYVSTLTEAVTTAVSGCTYVHGLVTPGGIGSNGDLNMTFIAAGFRPGLHVISLNGNVSSAGSPYSPYSYALFNVTTAGDWEYNMISGFSNSIATLSAHIDSLINGASGVNANIASAITSINSHTDSQLSTLSLHIDDLITGASGVNANIASAITSINSHTDSQISTLSSTISSAITSINSHTDSALTTISSDVSNIKTTVAGFSNVGTTATNVLNAVNTEQTYVLVVAVLAAITLVLVLAVLIRRLS